MGSCRCLGCILCFWSANGRGGGRRGPWRTWREILDVQNGIVIVYDATIWARGDEGCTQARRLVFRPLLSRQSDEVIFCLPQASRISIVRALALDLAPACNTTFAQESSSISCFPRALFPGTFRWPPLRNTIDIIFPTCFVEYALFSPVFSTNIWHVNKLRSN